MGTFGTKIMVYLVVGIPALAIGIPLYAYVLAPLNKWGWTWLDLLLSLVASMAGVFGVIVIVWLWSLVLVVAGGVYWYWKNRPKKQPASEEQTKEE